MQVSGIVSKRAFNESIVSYSSRHSYNTAHSRSTCSMFSVWPQWWQTVGGPRDRIWDLVAFVWPIRSLVITNSSAQVRCWNFFGGPNVHEIEISAMYNYIPLVLNQLLNVGVDQWFQICIMDTCQWVYVLIKSLFCKLVHFFISLNATVAWYPAETDMCALVTQ